MGCGFLFFISVGSFDIFRVFIKGVKREVSVGLGELRECFRKGKIFKKGVESFVRFCRFRVSFVVVFICFW